MYWKECIQSKYKNERKNISKGFTLKKKEKKRKTKNKNKIDGKIERLDFYFLMEYLAILF